MARRSHFLARGAFCIDNLLPDRHHRNDLVAECVQECIWQSSEERNPHKELLVKLAGKLKPHRCETANANGNSASAAMSSHRKLCVKSACVKAIALLKCYGDCRC